MPVLLPGPDDIDVDMSADRVCPPLRVVRAHDRPDTAADFDVCSHESPRSTWRMMSVDEIPCDRP